MAENDKSQEKTEQPTEKRLQDAKKKGQVARSRELNVLLSLLAAALVITMTGPAMMSNLIEAMTQGLALSGDATNDPGQLVSTVSSVAKPALFGLLPFLLVSIVAVFAGPMMVGGWAISADNIVPKFERLDPIKGIGRIFSIKSLVEFGKSVLKVVLIAGVALVVINNLLPRFTELVTGTPNAAVGELGQMLLYAFFVLSAVLVLIALVDVPYQMWQHNKQLMMTRQEVKDEMKESEGRPEVRSKRRQLQMEFSDRRMMEAVPDADVVITNPTHYAVALKYEDGLTGAPVVVAKGQDWIALRIREIAQLHEVPVFEAPPLARALHGMSDLNREIPVELYSAVAQVLAYIYQLKRVAKYQSLPNRPTSFDVPKEYLEPKS